MIRDELLGYHNNKTMKWLAVQRSHETHSLLLRRPEQQLMIMMGEEHNGPLMTMHLIQYNTIKSICNALKVENLI